MKKSVYVFALAFIVLSMVMASSPQAATLTWTASTGTVTGYRVHYGTSATNYTQHVEVGSVTQYVLDQLPLSQGVQYYFAVSAYNTAGESAYSTAVPYTPNDTTPPSTPSGLTAN